MSSEVPVVDVVGLRELLDRGAPVTILDVRPATERAEWSIPGSLHWDAYHALLAGDPKALRGLELPEDRAVVTVCAMGRTSTIAVRMLRERGVEAASLEGGMKAWSLAWNVAELTAPGLSLIQVRRTGKG